jgi:uncharacterized protein with HEPN domain
MIRHEYDAIEPDLLFDIVVTALPGLCAACEITLRKIQEDKE